MTSTISKPKTLILRAAGTNCDGETAHAFQLAGAITESIHVNRLLKEPGLLNGFQLLAIPGGFSYGDDIAAGRILANQLHHHLGDALRRFVDDGKPVIGICNGFQVLIKTNLLPGDLAGKSGQTCTLTNNDSGRFTDRWIRLAPVEGRCVWTQGLPALDLPIAHGEGKFVPQDETIRKALWSSGQVALQYANENDQPANGAFPANPNGSIDDIAGVCDASGLVFGLMPHPERYVDSVQHPSWTRQNPRPLVGSGLAVFQNGVRHAIEGVGAGV